MLEAMQWKKNSFVTLTYSDEKLRKTEDGLPTLWPKDLQDWLKRYRSSLEPLKIRFYGVGEYGGRTHRPHYHIIIFGHGGCFRGITRNKVGTTEPDPVNCCAQCALIHSTWGMGNIVLGSFSPESAAYVAGYTVKKLRKTDPLLAGRQSEFSRMSLRPAIGYSAVPKIVQALQASGRIHFDEDVPGALRHGSSLMPLGKTMMRRIRKELGRDEKAPETVIKRMEEEMSPVRDFAFNNSLSLKSVYEELAAPAALNIETKFNLKKRNTL